MHLFSQLWVSLAIMIAESVISLLPIIISYSQSLYSRHQQRSRSDLFVRSSEDGTSHPHDHAYSSDYYKPTRDSSTSSDDPEETETPDRLVPNSWVIIGLTSSAILGVTLVWLIFGNEGIKPWATAIGLVMACILSLLGVRALGETDLNPVSGIGKISQLIFAVLQPGNVVANIIAGGVAEAGAQQ